MEEPKENKKLDDRANKAAGSGDPRRASEGSVKIKFRQGRAADGVVADENGVATVDAQKAEYLVRIGYAEYVN